MVTIIGYKECISQNSNVFFSLILQGGITISKSENGNFYFTANKALIMTSFTEDYCKALVGKQLPGSITKVPCDEYVYVNSAGESVACDYKYEYSPKEEVVKEEATNHPQMQMPFPNMESIRAVA